MKYISCIYSKQNDLYHYKIHEIIIPANYIATLVIVVYSNASRGVIIDQVTKVKKYLKREQRKTLIKSLLYNRYTIKRLICKCCWQGYNNIKLG